MTESILMVIQDPTLAEQLQRLLESDGLKVSATSDPENAADLIYASHYDVLILDAECDGFAILEQVAGLVQDTPVLMFEGCDSGPESFLRLCELGIGTVAPKRERRRLSGCERDLPNLPETARWMVHRLLAGPECGDACSGIDR